MIHIGFNDIIHNTVDQIKVKDIKNRVINIGKKVCLTRHRSDSIVHILCDERKTNKFHLISNEYNNKEVWCINGLHLNNKDAYIFASSLVDF